jgi:hypothetical protein
VHIYSYLASQRTYSSMLSFTVPDINSTVSKLMSLGAELDGPIKYEIHGKVLCLYMPIIPLSYGITFPWNSYLFVCRLQPYDVSTGTC